MSQLPHGPHGLHGSVDEPKVTTWHADEGGGFGARLRRAGKDLFGRRR